MRAFRLTKALTDRIDAVVATYGVTFSAAVRLAIARGLREMEADLEHASTPQSAGLVAQAVRVPVEPERVNQQPRRRVLSKGVML